MDATHWNDSPGQNLANAQLEANTQVVPISSDFKLGAFCVFQKTEEKDFRQLGLAGRIINHSWYVC